MITLQMMQFTAVVLMLLLTVKLLLLRGRRIRTKVAKQARWLMVGGTLLLALHFFLQLKIGLRMMGITQSVMLNLAMLIPASYIFAIAVLLLQRREKLNRMEWLTGPVTWVMVMALLSVAIVTDGQPLLSDTQERKTAELMGAVLYMLMQGYYTWRHSKSLMAMRHALHDYYDRDIDGMLDWMQLSIVGLMLLALMVPVAIFDSGPWLLVIAFAIYFFIFYLVDSFCFYLTSPAPKRMQAAEQHVEEVEQERKLEMSSEVLQEVELAVEAWKAHGGYRKSGLLQPQAAQDIGVTRYRLTCWLHQKNMKYTEWIAGMRIEDAKRVMKEHPEWSNDAIAQHCGFKDRSVLQRTFKKLEGITPAQYMLYSV